jgi:hypothetical protein
MTPERLSDSAWTEAMLCPSGDQASPTMFEPSSVGRALSLTILVCSGLDAQDDA